MNEDEKVQSTDDPGDLMKCQSCGGDFDILMTTNKRKNMDGSSFWVCQDCFKEIEGVGYEDFKLSQTQD